MFNSITLTDTDMRVGPPIPVYRYTKYRDTAVNMGGIDTGIVLCNTVIFGIGNSGSQWCLVSSLWRFVWAL